jgi:hypothetical protein
VFASQHLLTDQEIESRTSALEYGDAGTELCAGKQAIFVARGPRNPIAVAVVPITVIFAIVTVADVALRASPLAGLPAVNRCAFPLFMRGALRLLLLSENRDAILVYVSVRLTSFRPAGLTIFKLISADKLASTTAAFPKAKSTPFARAKD